MLHRKMSKEDITQCLNFLGLDIENEDIINSKRNQLSKIRRKVLEMESKEQLPDNSYILLLFYENLLKREFCYPKEKAKYIEDSLSLLNDVSLINVIPSQSNNYTENFRRVNEIYIVILNGLDKIKKNGLCEVKIDELRNMSAKEVYERFVLPNCKKDIELFDFYSLIALSKLEDTGIDYEIFDEFGTLSSKKIFSVLKYGLSRKTNTNENKFAEKVKDDECVQKRLILRRPTYEEMKNLTVRKSNVNE